MSFKPLNTRDASTSLRKSLLIGSPGWGKTTQAKHFNRVYGPGFIISGESGLSSIRSAGIDYLPFTSFDGPVDPANNVYSFMAICKAIASKDFKAMNYKWLMLDSLTELSDLVYQWSDAKATADAVAQNKKVNGFEVWGTYKDRMIGLCKFLRDLPYHVVITALPKDVTDEASGETTKYPLLQGSAVQAQIPGIFDNVFCGVAKSVKQADGTMLEKRFVITGALGGWHGKVRDEHNVVKTIEETGDITEILAKMDAADKAAASLPTVA